jgi:DNA mismatch repair protein PMS2
VIADEAWLTRYTEVRFKNYGLDAVEVQDNGAGIAPDDYETIALKHYTSKLSTYDDLNSLKTFGFRGEALSSLCALSKFHIVTARAEDGPKGTKLDFEQSGKLSGTSMVAAKQGTTVVIETLFHNLPVRRKELEKNVKREYSKVLALLNAYACISVGVKFSVSNSMPKGKKTIAFATNSNSSTRGNISNVYGAKTVGALIPLDLEFQMDPSNRPGATQSARALNAVDDSDSRSVKIVGHISRPVVGEGRQTPDRQMFFVNSRPCNLPQVAKAFNEAYKAYNVTQSPFIFADIQLDTEAYDVNVSPDKRTIMLHDQTALLESLKESLAALFAGHDQSVPQSQLLGTETVRSGFKPPTMQSRGSAYSITAEVPDEPIEASESRASRRMDAASSPDVTDASLPGFVKASLIERFAGRDTEDRGASRPSRRRRMGSPGEENSPEERPPPAKRRDQAISPETTHVNPPSHQRSQSPLFEPEASTSPIQTSPEQPSRIIQDFNARVASQHAKQVERERSPKLLRPNRNVSDDDDDDDDDPIAAIRQTPQKSLSQSTIQNAFDRMRPMRTPVQKATITVGDTTTMSTIGSGSHSRSARQNRIHTPKFSSSGKALNQTPKLPLFMKSLQGFAAPGTQVEGSDDEDDQIQDSSLPTGPSPSLPESGRRRAFEEPQIDDLEVSSSIVLPRLPRIMTDESDSGANEPGGGEDTGMMDDEYIDDSEKKAREEEKIARMIAEAEEATARPTAVNLKRANKLFKVTHNKHSTIHLERSIATDADSIAQLLQSVQISVDVSATKPGEAANITLFNKQDPEERLSLTVTKPDFKAMRIIGQFNLGFIIVVRPPNATSTTCDLFIVDQHASDEKYNFERLSANTVLVSQRLVHPHFLELTAVEEEIVLANEHALTANGFVVEVGASDDGETGRRAKVTSLPMSKEITFTPTDLEELLALIMDNPPSSSATTSPHIPRPSKVKKLLASRACRSSVMIGKTLQTAQMENIVRHMGSMDKPWSCPHGRPTMRHLYGLESWNSWSEGDGVVGVDVQGGGADWAGFLKRNMS